jgi:hypothetical protein
VGVRVGCKVDEDEVDDELDDLNSGYPFFPPDSDAAGGLEVVPVHDDMDCQVEGDWDVALTGQRWMMVRGKYNRGMTDELSETENGCGTMMINMEKL